MNAFSRYLSQTKCKIWLMEIDFSSYIDTKYDALEARYKKIAEEAFSRLSVPDDYEVDVTLVDEKTIQEMNRNYRGVDRVTDVISFAYNEGEDPVSAFYAPGMTRILGEIYICVPRAISQAEEIGNSLGRELCFLFTHGLLHLLGYDHMNEEEAKVMFSLQEEILNVLGGDYGTY